MDSNILSSHFYNTPPITRFLFILILSLFILVYINAIQPYSLFYSPLFLKYLELWRPFTCFLYFGKPSLEVLIHMTFLYRYSKMLEEGFFFTSDYFYLIFIIWSLLFLFANIFNIGTMASAFSSTITYIWTRNNPNAMVQMFGFINFPAFYLPFIVPLFMLITEKHVLLEDLLGIFVGHVYYFFKSVYPKFGFDLLRTPCILKRLFREHPVECCKKINKARKISPKDKSNEQKNNEDVTQDITQDVIQDITQDVIQDTTNINEDTTNINEDTTNIQDISNISGDTTIKNESIINNSNVFDKSTEKDESKSAGFITNSTIGEESIKEYLNNKEKEEEEEVNGWSSETVSESDSDF
ncbi:derlin-2 (DERL2) [Vairimorpha necatrix]|uniref:Derlin n=1 Tax=Vairimorpha necatrix TaxID=6039 RepID=A0AAX4J867_9MICR